MTTDVVLGIFLDGKKFLVEKRLSDDVDAGFISIPGGHVDKGEELKDALKREMKEELDLVVKKAELVFKGLYTASNGEEQLCYYFFISDWSGIPISKEAERIFWETDVKNLTADIDRKAMLAVFEYINNHD